MYTCKFENWTYTIGKTLNIKKSDDLGRYVLAKPKYVTTSASFMLPLDRIVIFHNGQKVSAHK